MHKYVLFMCYLVSEKNLRQFIRIDSIQQGGLSYLGTRQGKSKAESGMRLKNEVTESVKIWF